MARQRFIWPDIWVDPVFGRLKPEQQVFFIGCFSIADDEGRLNADPAYLRSALYTYRDFTLRRVQTIRDQVVSECKNVHLYKAGNADYIALLRWKEYQHPKYPKPSKIPAPFLGDSPKLPPTLEEASSDPALRVGLGREGMDRAVSSAPNSGGKAATERPSGKFTPPNLREIA